MTFIQTKSFKLAVYQKGDPNSSRLALVLPGLADTKDYPHMRSHVDYLANRGYIAVSFDPSGTWESPGAFTLYTMTNYLKEINELIEYFDNRDTFVLGHSRGGSMAMIAGLRNIHVKSFTAIMSSYTLTTGMPNEKWKEQGYKISKRDLPDDLKTFIDVKVPYAFLLDQQQYDLTHELQICKKPKMFVVGEKDTILNPQIVRKGYELAASPKRLYSLDCNHDYRKDPVIVEKVNGFIGEFLDSHN